MPEEVADLRSANQEALVALAPDSRHFHAAGSSQFPQLSEPTIIVDAVRWVIERMRTNEPEPESVATEDDELQRTTPRPGSGA